MFVIGFVLSSITGLYLNNVLPISPVGMRQPWYYPCKKKYWCDGKREKKINIAVGDLSFEDDDFVE